MTDTRGTNEADAQRIMFNRMMMAMRTAIPGRVVSFDAAKQTVRVTPTIRRVVTIDGQQQTIQQSDCLNVPLVYPHGQTSGFALTTPVQVGDMVLLIAADRSIDNWADFGGIQNPVEPTAPRHHDISDSLAVIGATPAPQALANWQQNGIEMRNRARTSYVKVTDEAVEAHAQDVSLGTPYGPPVARIGDMVLIDSGSSAGMWPIVTGAANTRAS